MREFLRRRTAISGADEKTASSKCIDTVYTASSYRAAVSQIAKEAAEDGKDLYHDGNRQGRPGSPAKFNKVLQEQSLAERSGGDWPTEAEASGSKKGRTKLQEKVGRTKRIQKN